MYKHSNSCNPNTELSEEDRQALDRFWQAENAYYTSAARLAAMKRELLTTTDPRKRQTLQANIDLFERSDVKPQKRTLNDRRNELLLHCINTQQLDEPLPAATLRNILSAINLPLLSEALRTDC